MVYRGKPSTGCKKCRERKIKCDETAGGCQKCTERGFTCPGYPKLDVFLDESAHVQVKAKKANEKAIAARDAREQKSRGPSRAKALAIIKAHRESFIDTPFFTPLLERGIAFFMSNYALGLEEPPYKSDDYHSHLSTHGFHPIIATSMTALGLAGVANLSLDADMHNEAMRWYLKALNMTNAALASPKDVKSDNTLLATMLLSFFEATFNERSLMGFVNHVDGAGSLLAMRGKRQFDTPVGRTMYLQTVGLVAMSCMGQGISLPDFVTEMDKEIAKYEDPADPGNRFYHLHINVVNFRAQILQNQMSSFQAIIDRALELDADAKAVFDEAVPGWMYREVHCGPNTPGVFGDYYHIYDSHSAAQTWNWVRYNRVYLHDIIRNTLLLGFQMTPPAFVGEGYTKLLDESARTLLKMQSDVLATVPQYFHDVPNTVLEGVAPITLRRAQSPPLVAPASSKVTTRAPPLPLVGKVAQTHGKKFLWSNFNAQKVVGRSEFKSPGVSKARLPQVRVSGGYSSLWSLYIVGATPVATKEVQQYVIKTLLRAGTEFGINQAKVLAGALKLKTELDSVGFKQLEIVTTYLPIVGSHLDDETVMDDWAPQ